MPLFNCSVERCALPGVRGASCKLCNRHLCDDHLSPAFHLCPDWENDEQAWKAANERARRQELERLLSQLNLNALKARASALRHGVACTVPSLQYNKATISDIMGGTNFHIPITFVDGVGWLCRIRRSNVTAPTSDLQDRIIESEVSTLQFLATTTIPVPRVHDYGLHSSSNPIGVPYILMDRLNGHSFYWPEMRPFQKQKVMRQWADIVIELSRHPFSAIGCLIPSSTSSWQAGPIVFDSHADRNNNGQLMLPGPFTTSTDYRRDIIARHLQQIRSKQTPRKRRLDAYLLHLFLLENVSAIARIEDPSGAGFYLKHMDDKGDHILVDDDHNIVGIIDWEWAQTCPKAEAFNSPLCFLSTADYYNGNNALGPEEVWFAEILESKGAHELAQYVRNGRVEHRVSHSIGCDILEPMALATASAALYSALLGSKHEGTRDWKAWRRQALQKYQNDEGLREILREVEADAADAYAPEPPSTLPFGLPTM